MTVKLPFDILMRFYPISYLLYYPRSLTILMNCFNKFFGTRKWTRILSYLPSSIHISLLLTIIFFVFFANLNVVFNTNHPLSVASWLIAVQFNIIEPCPCGDSQIASTTKFPWLSNKVSVYSIDQRVSIQSNCKQCLA